MRGALSALLLASLVGCTGGEAGETRETEPTQANAPEPQATAPRGETGTVVGVVRLAEGSTLPRLPLDAARSARSPSAACPAIRELDHTPVYEVDGKLVNVLVTATGDPKTFFPALPEREPAEVELTVGADCRLAPRLVGAVEGDTLILKNRGPVATLPFVGKQGFVESLAVSESRSVPLEARGVRRVACGVAGYCGSSDVVVIPHPVFGVTGEDGRFVVDNVPADQDVLLHAWHPLFRQASLAVRVGKGEQVEVELVITPARSQRSQPAEPAAPAD